MKQRNKGVFVLWNDFQLSGFWIYKEVPDILVISKKWAERRGDGMDAQIVGQRIKAAREARGLTQEALAAMVDLSPTHISVIERGLKTPNLDSFVAIANALGVSADALLVDVVDHVEESIACELSTQISRLPLRERSKILNAIRILIEE